MWEAGECTEQLQKFRKEFLIINRLKMTKVTIVNQSDCSIAGPHQYILSIGPGIVPNFLEWSRANSCIGIGLQKWKKKT